MSKEVRIAMKVRFQFHKMVLAFIIVVAGLLAVIDADMVINSNYDSFNAVILAHIGFPLLVQLYYSTRSNTSILAVIEE